MGHTCQPIQRSSDKDHRPQIKRAVLHLTAAQVKARLFQRLREKGFGAWMSRHEILGMVTEEYLELGEAVHKRELADVRFELMDIAVACVFAIACIDSEALDW